MKRTILIALALVLTLVGIGSAAVLRNGFAPASPSVSPTVAALPEPTLLPAPVPTAAATAVPTPTATPTPAPTTEEPEASETPSGDVALVQQRLKDLKYYDGVVDGKAGPATASAVQAFQKVQGLSADGSIGPNTLAALDAPRTPSLRGGASNRIEVDLDAQVLYFVQGGSLSRIMPISSGSGDSYANPGGGTAQSLTPVGNFTITRHISGERNAPLGTLYDPMYFYSGWAIHGSNSVPAYPASHGCVRVTRSDAKWLFGRAPIGMNVSIYGNRNAFSPAAGETAGTSTPAGDTAATTPDDGIQDEPVATPVPAASPTLEPTQPAPSSGQPSQPAQPTQPSQPEAPVQPAPPPAQPPAPAPAPQPATEEPPPPPPADDTQNAPEPSGQ